MVSRTYRRCEATTTKGNRCRANSLPGETVCELHLPETDPRRVAETAKRTAKTRAYWVRWRLARDLAAAGKQAA